ncbi:MAG: MXAN_5187 C-terminal domain-containing protein [Myxococcota bacterium]
MAENSADSIRAQNARLEEELGQIAEGIRQLKVQYDRYFMGLDRIPPLKARAELERFVRDSKLGKSHKTGVKFRFRNMRQSLISNATRWDRIMRLIEEGKFKRDRNALQGMGVRTVEDEPKAGAPTTRGGGASAAAASDDPTRKVFETWQAAQSQLGNTAKVDYEKFRDKLERQKQEQISKHGWKDIDYAVRVKDGKVALVARPVKGEG